MVLLRNGRLFTASEWGTHERASVLIAGERIAWVGEGDPPAEAADAEVIDLGGALVTPGLIDAHTHPVYLEPRLEEVAQRSAGASYADIAARGGGIVSTVAATRGADPSELSDAVEARLRRWPLGGTTTVEAKTGYHLDRDGELRAVGILAGLRGREGLPRLAITFLAAHAVPSEWQGRQPEYVREAAGWAGAARAAGADFVDVFCDEGYFTVEESRQVLVAGAAAGLVPRIHADELARTGGSLLAAQVRAASADHVLRITAADAHALAAAQVVATLAPATALSLGVRPPVADLVRAACPIALGSDHNPGTSGITSMALVVSLAVSALGLSVDQALRAATAGGAASLRLVDRGRLVRGLLADLVVWDADHEGAFAWDYGPRPKQVYLGGRLLT